MIHRHHVHLFSHDLDCTVAWYRRAFDAEVYYDGDFGGSRNGFMKIGTGGIHFYSQPPPHNGKGAIHHIAIRTNDLAGLGDRLLQMGVRFRSGVREFRHMALPHVPAPDLEDIGPIAIAAYIEEPGSKIAQPSVKEHLTAIRQTFDYLVSVIHHGDL